MRVCLDTQSRTYAAVTVTVAVTVVMALIAITTFLPHGIEINFIWHCKNHTNKIDNFIKLDKCIIMTWLYFRIDLSPSPFFLVYNNQTWSKYTITATDGSANDDNGKTATIAATRRRRATELTVGSSAPN